MSILGDRDIIKERIITELNKPRQNNEINRRELKITIQELLRGLCTTEEGVCMKINVFGCGNSVGVFPANEETYEVMYRLGLYK